MNYFLDDFLDEFLDGFLYLFDNIELNVGYRDIGSSTIVIESVLGIPEQ